MQAQKEARTETEVQLGPEKRALPETYPTYKEGDVFELDGWPFEVARINASSLVLRPVLPAGEFSHRKLIRKMT